MAEQYVVSAVLGPFDSKEAAEEALSHVKDTLEARAARVPGSPVLYCDIIGAGSGN